MWKDAEASWGNWEWMNVLFDPVRDRVFVENT